MAAQSPLDKEIQVIIIAILAASYFRFLVGNRALGAVTMGGLCERFAIKFYSNGKKLILAVLLSFDEVDEILFALQWMSALSL